MTLVTDQLRKDLAEIQMQLMDTHNKLPRSFKLSYHSEFEPKLMKDLKERKIKKFTRICKTKTMEWYTFGDKVDKNALRLDIPRKGMGPLVVHLF